MSLSLLVFLFLFVCFFSSFVLPPITVAVLAASSILIAVSVQSPVTLVDAIVCGCVSQDTKVPGVRPMVAADVPQTHKLLVNYLTR
jgi:hypothetical protein